MFRQNFRWLMPCLLLLITCHASAEQPTPSIDDATLLRLIPGGSYKLPNRIFPSDVDPEAVKETFGRLITGDAARAATWAGIPDELWQQLITDYAPITMKGNNHGVCGRDPFNNDNFFEGAAMTHEEFLANPFVAKTIQGGHLVYGREADMPADWPFRPNKTISVPHLDGTMHEYAFWVPEDMADADASYNSGRRHWLSPAGTVYQARLTIIMREILPDLIAAVYKNHDERAAHQLAVILDRMADVYPGLPLISQQLGNGFARSPDGSSYLTADQYNTIVVGTPHIGFQFPPPWWHGIYDYNYAKFNWGIPGWTDGVMGQLGTYAIAFDLVRDLPTTTAWSTMKYNDSSAWEKRVRERLIEPARVLGRFNPPTLGNTAYGYISGAVPLGIISGDQYLFDKGLSIAELYLYNNWLEDGMPCDGAFNYALMTYGVINYRWMYEAFGGERLEDKFPLLETIAGLGFRPVTTLYNIGSKHADQHARFFRSRRPWMPPPQPDKIPYSEHEVSQSFPVYGLTALRGGAPGSRLELILDHQDTGNHTHESRLNVQLFYEGVELLPDFGYSVAMGVDPTQSPWKDLGYPYEMLPTPEPNDKWGPWRHQYAFHPEAHCLATIDHWLAAQIPMSRQAYLGGMPVDNPGYWAQFVDADGSLLFQNFPTPVDTFRRQLAVITLPDGRSLALDFFRLRGGSRHDLFWHVPSETMPTSLGDGQPVPEKTLEELWKLKRDYFDGKVSRHFSYAHRQIHPTTRYPMPDNVWTADFHVEPHKFLPRDPKAYGGNTSWPEILHDVNLRLWGYAAGSESQSEVMAARGPWPGNLEDIDPQTGELVRGTIAFKDVLAYVIESRTSVEPGLETSYAHVLEPRNPDQTAVLTNVEVLARLPMAAGGGLAVKASLAGGGELLAASTLNGESVETPAIALHGRFGAAVPVSGYLTLFDGTRLQAGGWQVELAPSWQMKLVGIIGDLTGSPSEAALIVASDRPLPTDDTLVGQPVEVDHQIGPAYMTPYTIASVKTWGEGAWRIDLANTPTFLQNRMHVMSFNADDPKSIVPEFRLYRGSGEVHYKGRRIRFPRTGWETTVASGAKELVLAEQPPADKVVPGDPFVIYTIQPGDSVTIHSHFASRGTTAEDGMDLDIVATGGFTLTAPSGQKSTIAPSDMANGHTKLHVTQ